VLVWIIAIEILAESTTPIDHRALPFLERGPSPT